MNNSTVSRGRNDTSMRPHQITDTSKIPLIIRNTTILYTTQKEKIDAIKTLTCHQL